MLAPSALPQAPSAPTAKTGPDPRPTTRDGAPRRILHVFRAPVGGLFRHVVDLTRLQTEAGHAVGIFCDASTGGERAAATLAALAPTLALGVTRVPMRRNPHASDIRALASLRALQQQAKADVLHGHGSKGGLYARLVPTSSGGGTIRAYTPHGGSFNYQPGSALHRLYMTAEAFLTRRTDVLLFESQYIAERFATFVGPTDRLIRIVPNGLSEAEFAPVPLAPNHHDLVYIGELRQAKGIGDLIEAVALLRMGGRRLTLLIVGSGPDAVALARKVVDLEVSSEISFAPPQPIREALSKGRVMVVPSLAESLPYVVLEAAAAAHPLVATRVGGIPEIFGPSADALVPPSDPTTLAGAILRILDAPAEVRAARAAELSRYVAGRFSLTRMGESVLAGYAAAHRGLAPAAALEDPAVPGKGRLPAAEG